MEIDDLLFGKVLLERRDVGVDDIFRCPG